MKKELIIVQAFDKDGFLTGYKVKGELVRCKYCEHWKRQVGEIGDDFFCAFDQNKSYREDFFCADGERRSK